MKTYVNNEELTRKLMAGVDTLADNVATTLGPRGRNVILKSKTNSQDPETKKPIITKDGVTVAEFVDLNDPIENLGAQLVKQAAVQTVQVAGDGTTTATVLARALLKQATLYLSQGVAPIELRRGMEAALEDVLKALREQAVRIRTFEDIKSIATVSANNDPVIGDLVARAVDLTGKDGAISIKNSKNNKTSLEMAEGFRFDGGFHSREFINNRDLGACVFEDALVFITDIALTEIQQIMDILNLAARKKVPLVVVAPEVGGNALAGLIANSMRGTMKIVAVKPGYYGEEQRGLLKDLAVVTGAKFCTVSNVEFDANGTIGFDADDFGVCKKIEVFKGRSTILEGGGEQEQVDNRITELKVELKHTEDMRESERIQKRISRLASGIAMILVGGYSDIEVIETRHRVEDALEAVASAVDGGMLPGGGVTLLRLSQKLTVPRTLSEEQRTGYNIVLKAMQEPFLQIARNAGESPEVCKSSVLKKKDKNVGYNFATNKVENLVDSGIIDPFKVTTTALKSAVSVAGTILLTNYAIVEN